jgi:hypothetical protein
MSNYVQSTNFATKDALPSGDPLKIVKGTEINTEFNNIAVAVATKADLNSPTLVSPALGTPSSGNLANCTFPTLNQNTTGTAANVTGTVVVANGGTGATSFTSGALLKGNGTSAVSTASAADIVGQIGSTAVTNATNATNATTAAACSGNSATATKLTTASGSAPSYSARAWVNFDGSGTVAIRASGNVSSITDNGTGDYTVNFSTAMQDADYAAVATALYVANNEGISVGTFNRASGSVQLLIKEPGVSTNDSSNVDVAIFR